MPTEIISALISLAGVALSALVSLFVAKYEVKKQKLTWLREDAQAFSSEFARACHCVMNYLDCQSLSHKKLASRAVLMLQASAPNQLLPILSRLYEAINSEDIPLIQQELEKLISQKQKI